MLIAACGGTDGSGGTGDALGGGGGAGCGGAPSAAECADDAATFHSAADARQSCASDSDCTVVEDSCFGPAFCATYMNQANAATARAALAHGRIACAGNGTCAGVECMAPAPAACVAGVCTFKPRT